MSPRGFVPSLLILSLLHCGAPTPPESPSPATAAAPPKGSPSAEDVQEALTRGDVEKARAILEVLASRDGETAPVRDARDAIALADAEKLTGAEKLAALDPITARGGTHAEEAAQSAKAERLRQVQQLIDAKKPAEAIAAIDRWFGDPSKSDAQVAEARARAHDVASALCGDVTCRYLEAYRASAWASTPDRTAKIGEARTAVVAALTFQEVPAETALDSTSTTASIRRNDDEDVQGADRRLRTTREGGGVESVG